MSPSISLETLPEHIRERILVYVLGNNNEVYRLEGRQPTQNTLFPFRRLRVSKSLRTGQWEPTYLLTNPLLQVSRSTRQEVLTKIVTNNTWAVKRPERLQAFASYMSTMGIDLSRSLRFLNLEIWRCHWAELRSSKPEGIVALGTLTQCQGLQKVHIKIDPDWVVKVVATPYENRLATLRTADELSRLTIFAVISNIKSLQVIVQPIEREMSWHDRADGLTTYAGTWCEHSKDEGISLLERFCATLQSSMKTRGVSSTPMLANRQGGTCPLLEIPREVRDQILANVLKRGTVQTAQSGDSDCRSVDKEYLKTLFHHPLMSVNRQIRSEALDMLHGSNTFKAPSFHLLNNFLKFLGPDEACHITSLEVNLYDVIQGPGFEEMAQAIHTLNQSASFRKIKINLDIALLPNPNPGATDLKRNYYLSNTWLPFLLSMLRGLRMVELRWIPFREDLSWAASSIHQEILDLVAMELKETLTRQKAVEYTIQEESYLGPFSSIAKSKASGCDHEDEDF